MASGSPRKHIDQFFASKKRKPESPVLKKHEKSNNEVEGRSPSAKGTLDNYLVNSQNDKKTSKTSRTESELLGKQDPVRRNLSSEINSSLKDECHQPVLPSQSQTHEASEAAQMGKSEALSEVGDAAVELAKGNAASLQGVENSELKKFASDLLSLYCSELQSNGVSPSELRVNDLKRQASPSLPQVSKKKHCLRERLHLECDENISEEKQPGVLSRTGVANDMMAPTLKRCNNTPKSSVRIFECCTPGSLTRKACFHETPKSTRGSSIFSPGEAFWDEAIQLADGLCGPTVSLCAQAAGEIGAIKSQYPTKNSCNFRRGNYVGKVKDAMNEGGNMDIGAKPHMNLDKENSPLPVKHFDFSLEDKCLDNRILYHPGTDDLTDLVYRVGEPSELGLRDHNALKNANTIYGHSSSRTGEEMYGEQEMPSVSAVIQRKADLVGEDNDSLKSDSPHEVAKPIDNNKSGESTPSIMPYRDRINSVGDNNDSVKSDSLREVTEPNGSHESGEGTPSSIMPDRDRLNLDCWLPSEICSIYKKKGILKLYPWQVDCLQVDGVLQRRNLVYCASTSAGKSFVAEILMLRRVLSSGKMALLVLPYVSICAEKAEHLEVLLEPLGKHVRSYYGNQGGGALPRDTSVAVCTIEKANSLINRLLEEGRLSEIGIIVIDELHMVGDRSRGYLLELMLTKLRYAVGEGTSEASSGESSGMSSSKVDTAQGLQIVGMSATMPNVAAVADWLQAALYQTVFRPVPLEEYIKVGNTIYNKDKDIVRTIPKVADLGGKDPDHIVELCNEVVQDDHSVLIFCSSRKGCESTARHVSRFIKTQRNSAQNDDTEFADVTSAIEALRRCPAGLDPILEETLPFGVAFHHAGLTVEEREVVETCYRKGLVRVLTATSTLAAGVNLPARRVIFRQPRIGCDFIDGTRYKQMAGRAGRTGIDTKGESVLICKPEEIKRISALLNDSCPPLHSCLSEDMNGMIHAILEVVAGGIVQTANDIHRYVKCTLLNSTKPFEDVVKSAQESLRWLCHRKFLEWNDATKLYNTTPLGRAAFGSSLSPEESLIVLDDLSRAREGFVLASDLHLVYLVTPINVDVEPNWELYYERFFELSALDQSVGNRVGVTEPFLMRMAHGAPMCASNRSKENVKGLHGKSGIRLGISDHTLLSDDQALRVCKRFYVALILSRLVQETPIAEVCEAFKVARGMVQALQENAGRFASMVSLFCERLGWHDLEGLVAKFQNRVSFGVRAEIVELTTIPYVKGSRARALYKSGLRTPLAVAEASIPEIVKALFESSSWAAQGQRHMQVGVAKKIKNGARKIVLEKAEEARTAAFAAYKSLGFNVSQFSRPALSTAIGSHYLEEPTTSSHGTNDNTRNFVDKDHLDNATKQSSEGTIHSDRVISVSGMNCSKMLDIGIGTSAEVNLTGDMQHNVGADNSMVPIEGFVALQHKLLVAVDHTKNVDTTHPIQSQKLGDRTMIDKNFDPAMGKMNSREILCSGHKVSVCEEGPINAIHTPGGFDSFLDLWDTAGEFCFDIHYNKRSDVNSAALFEVLGIAICWENSPVYYVNIPKDLLWFDGERNDCLLLNASCDKKDVLNLDHRLEMARHRWNKISGIMRKKDVRKFTWNLKVQVQALKSPAVSLQKFCSRKLAAGENVGFEVIDSPFLLLTPIHVRDGIDMCIVAWMLWPDEERSSNPNLEKEVKKRLSSDAAAAANRNGRWKNQMRRAAHNGCCRRVAQIRALSSVLWKLLVSEELTEALLNVEIPLVNVLADMEVWGIGVDMEECLQARNVLGKKLRQLEKEAYKLAGMTFSLYTAADIANVLYRHLKLPVPDGKNKGKQHPSTDKHCLDLLRHEHPIIPVIKEHRTLAKLLNCTLGSICSLSRLSVKTQKYTLHGHWLQTSTATGRLSMEEPNLQCVEHMVEFKISKAKYQSDTEADCYKINARDYFVPTKNNWLLLTADYSQIELRLMAHFSKDASLIEILSKSNGDVFTMIAARWTGCPEDSVGTHERDQTKRLVYGILYGMGPNTLAENLKCSPAEAAEKIQSFKSSFPGVSSWLNEAVAHCRDKGYVVTLKGRKRFLSKIKFGNSKEKAKAQRQAVNSICQGSSADIIKIAMINIYSVISEGVDTSDCTSLLATKFHMLKGCCRILLQVHDELVLEVDPLLIKEAALLLQMCMENAASLLVPLHVKLKVGRTWGSLEPFQADQYRDKLLVPDP